MKTPEINPELALIGVGAIVVIYLASKAGKAAAAAAGAAASAVKSTAQVVNAGTTGVVAAISNTVGLPTPSQTIDDPAQVRWIIDNVGYMSGSEWGTAWAFIQALGLPAGSGKAPPGWGGASASSANYDGAGRYSASGSGSAVDMTAISGTTSPGSFNSILQSDPLDPLSWGTYN